MKSRKDPCLLGLPEILRRAESSSHCNFLRYQECQAPVPRRLLHRIAVYSVLEQLISIILFQGINSSASQANENELVGTPRPPLKHNMQKRRNFTLGDVLSVAYMIPLVKTQSWQRARWAAIGRRLSAALRRPRGSEHALPEPRTHTYDVTRFRLGAQFQPLHQGAGCKPYRYASCDEVQLPQLQASELRLQTWSAHFRPTKLGLSR